MTKLKNLGYIYKVTNIITSQFYIGQRSSYKGTPEVDLGYNYFTSSKIVKPLFKNNTSEWKKEILYRDIQYSETLDSLEGYAIHKDIKNKLCLNKYDPTSCHGFHFNGCHLSDSSKEKIRQANIGKHMSSDVKYKISSKLNNNVISKETKIKMSNAKKGHFVSLETREKIGSIHKGSVSPMRGKHFSEEARKHMSEAKKGKHPSEEAKRKRSEGLCLYYKNKKLEQEKALH